MRQARRQYDITAGGRRWYTRLILIIIDIIITRDDNIINIIVIVINTRRQRCSAVGRSKDARRGGAEVAVGNVGGTGGDDRQRSRVER